MADSSTRTLIDNCRSSFQKARRSARSRDQEFTALADALIEANRISRLAAKFPRRKRILYNAYEEFSIAKPKSGTNQFTRIVKLLIPGRKTNDYSRYANALYYFHSKGWKGSRIRKELEEHSLTHFSDLGRKLRAKEKDGLAGRRGGLGDAAKKHLRHADKLGSLTYDAESMKLHGKEWAVLIGRVTADRQDEGELDILASIECSEELLRSVFARYARQNELSPIKPTRVVKSSPAKRPKKRSKATEHTVRKGGKKPVQSVLRDKKRSKPSKRKTSKSKDLSSW